MFGDKRFCKDLSELDKVAKDLSEEEFGKRLCASFVRFGIDNFIGGCLITATGGIAGILGINGIRKIKEKKKCKELTDTDK